MMRKAIALFMGLTLLSGCIGDVTIYSKTEIKHYPSRQQEKHPRGKEVFSCTTMAALYEYLENGIVSEGCGYRQMTAASYRGDFYTSDGRRFKIVQFQENFMINFTYEERGHEPRRKRRIIEPY